MMRFHCSSSRSVVSDEHFDTIALDYGAYVHLNGQQLV